MSPFPPVDIVTGSPASGLLFLCDHASNALPPGYGTLGLPTAELARHIGYDIGAASVTRALAARFGAPAFLTTFSRLLIDPNRGEDDPTLVMRLSDGAIVPGNRHVDAAEINHRIEAFYRPYHAAIAAHLDQVVAAGAIPLIFSMHSFTPVWKGNPRPWQIAILWDKDPRMARPMIDHFRRDPALTVGDNQPYDGCLEGDTLHRHATKRGIPHVLVEVRQDLIADDGGVAEWTDRLAAVLSDLLADPTLRRIEHWGSRSDR